MSDARRYNGLDENETKQFDEQNQCSSNGAVSKNGRLNGKSVAALTTPVMFAAMWLSAHRDEIEGAPLPFVRQTFGLSALDAIEALKAGHALRYGPGNVRTEA